MMYFTCDNCHTQYPITDSDLDGLHFYEIDGERHTMPNYYADDETLKQICDKCQKEEEK